MHVSYILEAKKLERAALRKSKKELRTWRSRKKPPIFSTLKKRLDKYFCAISQQAKLFSVVHKDFCVKQDRFVPYSLKHGGNMDYSHEEDDKNNDDATGSQVNFSSQSAKISERASSCTNLSAIGAFLLVYFFHIWGFISFFLFEILFRTKELATF